MTRDKGFCVPCHLLLVTCYLSPVTLSGCYLSPVTSHQSPVTSSDDGHEKRRGCCRCPRRSLRRARRILAAMPREPSGSRFSSQRPIEESSVPPTVQPALLREAAASGCTRCLSRFAPDFLGESGPFCPICLGLRGGITLSAPGVFPLRIARAIGQLPTRSTGIRATLYLLGKTRWEMGDVRSPARRSCLIC